MDFAIYISNVQKLRSKFGIKKYKKNRSRNTENNDRTWMKYVIAKFMFSNCPDRISISRKWKFNTCQFTKTCDVKFLIVLWNRFNKGSWIKRYHNRSLKMEITGDWSRETDMRKHEVDNSDNIPNSTLPKIKYLQRERKL